ncbi:hypothetical protein YC2023_112944 [Brassica napus]
METETTKVPNLSDHHHMLLANHNKIVILDKRRQQKWTYHNKIAILETQRQQRFQTSMTIIICYFMWINPNKIAILEKRRLQSGQTTINHYSRETEITKWINPNKIAILEKRRLQSWQTTIKSSFKRNGDNKVKFHMLPISVINHNKIAILEKRRQQSGQTPIKSLFYRIGDNKVKLHMLPKSMETPNKIAILEKRRQQRRMTAWIKWVISVKLIMETVKVLSSTISERQAEQEKYMPDLAALFPHVLVDVSSVKSLCTRWFPRDKNRAPAKKNNHRAMDDIRESIKELKYYKETIFKANKGRR